MSFLPPSDIEYLNSKGFAFEEINDAGRKGIILKARPLPRDRFDSVTADILILLPPSYPDCPPDMFYLLPWVRLVDGNRFPNAADQPLDYAGKNWQRWSRHCDEWRPGIDGIWTMIKRIETALEIAA